MLYSSLVYPNNIYINLVSFYITWASCALRSIHFWIILSESDDSACIVDWPTLTQIREMIRITQQTSFSMLFTQRMWTERKNLMSQQHIELWGLNIYVHEMINVLSKFISMIYILTCKTSLKGIHDYFTFKKSIQKNIDA